VGKLQDVWFFLQHFAFYMFSSKLFTFINRHLNNPCQVVQRTQSHWVSCWLRHSSICFMDICSYLTDQLDLFIECCNYVLLCVDRLLKSGCCIFITTRRNMPLPRYISSLWLFVTYCHRFRNGFYPVLCSCNARAWMRMNVIHPSVAVFSDVFCSSSSSSSSSWMLGTWECPNDPMP